jgi:hypothetical protein
MMMKFREVWRRMREATDPDSPYTPIDARRPLPRVDFTAPGSVVGRTDPYDTLRPRGYGPRDRLGTSSATLVIRQSDDPRPTDHDGGLTAFARAARRRGYEDALSPWTHEALGEMDKMLRTYLHVERTQTYQRRTVVNQGAALADTGELRRRGQAASAQIAMSIVGRARHASMLTEQTGQFPAGALDAYAATLEEADA